MYIKHRLCESYLRAVLSIGKNWPQPKAIKASPTEKHN